MDIWIPKYKELHIRDGVPSLKVGHKGEFRATLRGPDGRIKYTTGWRPNMILDQGIAHFTGYYNGSFITPLSTAYVGTSATPTVQTMTGIQGTVLGSNTSQIVGARTNLGTPNYEKVSIMSYVWSPASGEGTINEFVICGAYTGSNGTLGAGLRQVMPAPIVKGPFDELTIDHKLTFQLPVTSNFGVMDISGEDYDYEVGMFLVQNSSAGHTTVLRLNGEGNQSYAGTASRAPTILEAKDATAIEMGGISGAYFYGGVLGGDYWQETRWTADVDWGPRDINYIYSPIIDYGMFTYFTKVSDGTPLSKTDTHEFKFNMRIISVRGTP